MRAPVGFSGPPQRAVRDMAFVEYGSGDLHGLERRDRHEVRWIAHARGGADRRVGLEAADEIHRG